MLDFLTKFFRREESSKSLAKERLRLVLMSDRVSLAPDTFDAMKGEMLGVLQRYLEIDEHNLDVHFENAERRFVLLANIPVNHVKSGEEIESERRRFAVNGNGTGGTALTPPRRRRRRRRAAANGAANGSANGTRETGSQNGAQASDEHQPADSSSAEPPESRSGPSNGSQEPPLDQ